MSSNDTITTAVATIQAKIAELAALSGSLGEQGTVLRTELDGFVQETTVLQEHAHRITNLLQHTPAPEQQPKGFTVLRGVAEVLVLASVLLYVSGWSYLYSFYRRFGISLKELDISTYDALVYAMNVLRTDRLTIIVSVVIWCALLVLAYRRKRLITGAWVLPAVFFLTIGSYHLASRGMTLGSQRARLQMNSATSTLPYVTFQTEPNKLPEDLVQPLGNPKTGYVELGYKLVLHAKNNYYLFQPVTGTTTELAQTNVDVIVLPETALRGLRMQVVYAEQGELP